MKRLFEHTPLLNNVSAEAILWIVFVALVTALLIVDFRWSRENGVKGRKVHVSLTILTIISAVLYGVFICLIQDHINGFIFFSAYLTEYSLSIDNLFAFAIIFEYFKLTDSQQSKVLLWGVLSAMVFRLAFVFVGAELIERFEWLLYVLAALLLGSGIKMFVRNGAKKLQPAKNWIGRFVFRFFPVSTKASPETFLVKEQNKVKLTYLFVALIFVELTDILFALDSLPAAFGITRDKELILTSNILAVMGLRSLFFLLNDFLKRFAYLQKAVPLVLIFIAFKMLAELMGFIMNSVYSFLVIFSLLGGAVILSILNNKRPEREVALFSENLKNRTL